MTPQETNPDLPVSVQEPAAEAWVSGDLVQGLGVLHVAVLKEVTIIFITSTRVWHQGKQQRGYTAPPINRKLDSRFTEHGHTLQNKTQFPPQLISPIRTFHKLLILLHQREDRMKITITEN